ncbi:hypothetical protein NPIL_161361 [Nephila pilipes]|uniref:Uncharacterized protein n=1 Tax=Nephila pilipes TaxID=299642 RepID=A0A8X6NRA1_NEPPI|nr:hypothetical protein NPIL_161361 [Nephila pilipes]
MFYSDFGIGFRPDHSGKGRSCIVCDFGRYSSSRRVRACRLTAKLAAAAAAAASRDGPGRLAGTAAARLQRGDAAGAGFWPAYQAYFAGGSAPAAGGGMRGRMLTRQYGPATQAAQRRWWYAAALY